MLDYCEPVPTTEWHEREASWIEAERANRRRRFLEQRVFEKALAAGKTASREAIETLATRFSEHVKTEFSEPKNADFWTSPSSVSPAALASQTMICAFGR